MSLSFCIFSLVCVFLSPSLMGVSLTFYFSLSDCLTSDSLGLSSSLTFPFIHQHFVISPLPSLGQVLCNYICFSSPAVSAGRPPSQCGQLSATLCHHQSGSLWNSRNHSNQAFIKHLLQIQFISRTCFSFTVSVSGLCAPHTVNTSINLAATKCCPGTALLHGLDFLCLRFSDIS